MQRPPARPNRAVHGVTWELFTNHLLIDGEEGAYLKAFDGLGGGRRWMTASRRNREMDGRSERRSDQIGFIEGDRLIDDLWGVYLKPFWEAWRWYCRR